MAKLEEGMEVCESCEVHENLLKIVNEKMPEETELYDLAHQLRILKQNKLVKSRREGKSVFYSLADDHVRTIVDQGREHIEEDL